MRSDPSRSKPNRTDPNRSDSIRGRDESETIRQLAADAIANAIAIAVAVAAACTAACTVAAAAAAAIEIAVAASAIEIAIEARRVAVEPEMRVLSAKTSGCRPFGDKDAPTGLRRFPVCAASPVCAKMIGALPASSFPVNLSATAPEDLTGRQRALDSHTVA